MKTFVSVLFLSFSILLCTSCKREGCTNPDAVNYDVTADEDDGSCIVCNTETIDFSSKELPLVDKRTSSPYYNDTVGIFHLYQYLDVPNDKVCGREECYITMDLQNLVNQSMQVSFIIETVTGPVNFYHSDNALVDPMATFDFGVIQQMNFPPYYKISLDSLKVTVNGYIQYY